MNKLTRWGTIALVILLTGILTGFVLEEDKKSGDLLAGLSPIEVLKKSYEKIKQDVKSYQFKAGVQAKVVKPIGGSDSGARSGEFMASDTLLVIGDKKKDKGRIFIKKGDKVYIQVKKTSWYPLDSKKVKPKDRKAYEKMMEYWKPPHKALDVIIPTLENAKFGGEEKIGEISCKIIEGDLPKDTVVEITKHTGGMPSIMGIDAQKTMEKPDTTMNSTVKIWIGKEDLLLYKLSGHTDFHAKTKILLLFNVSTKGTCDWSFEASGLNEAQFDILPSEVKKALGIPVEEKK